MWRAVDQDPVYFEGRKLFWCKVSIGSMAPKIEEMKVSGYWTEHYGFKWSLGDWQNVIEWMYLEEKRCQ